MEPQPPPGPAAADTGVLSPGWAGDTAAALVSDQAWLAAMAQAEGALARAQAQLGLIPARAAEVIGAVAGSVPLDLAAAADGVHATATPAGSVAAQLRAEVARRDEAAARCVHLGATSQDIVDTASMLVATRALAQVRGRLRTAADHLAGLAREHRDTPMTARTLTQRAVPTTFGLKAAGWLNLVLDALDEVGPLAGGALPAQLGGAAGTLAAWQELAGPDAALALPAAFAARLGLAAPLVPWHTARTPVARIAAAACVIAGALGKMAADVLVLSRTEIAEVAEPGGPGRGTSTAMPDKHNPVLAIQVAVAARQVPPLALVLFQSMAAEDERPPGAWQAEWQPLREVLRLLLGAAANAAELTAGLQVRGDAMRRHLAGRAGGPGCAGPLTDQVLARYQAGGRA